MLVCDAMAIFPASLASYIILCVYKKKNPIIITVVEADSSLPISVYNTLEDIIEL